MVISSPSYYLSLPALSLSFSSFLHTHIYVHRKHTHTRTYTQMSHARTYVSILNRYKNIVYNLNTDCHIAKHFKEHWHRKLQVSLFRIIVESQWKLNTLLLFFLIKTCFKNNTRSLHCHVVSPWHLHTMIVKMWVFSRGALLHSSR